MGHFTIRCAITNVQIARGEEIVAVPVIYMPEYRGEVLTCTPRCQYRVIGLPMFGTYDEYGGVDVHANDVGAKYNATLFNTTVDNVGNLHNGAVGKKLCKLFFHSERNWEPEKVEGQSWVERTEKIMVSMAYFRKEAWDKALTLTGRYSKMLHSKHIRSIFDKIPNLSSRLEAKDKLSDALYGPSTSTAIEKEIGVELSKEEHESLRVLLSDTRECHYAFKSHLSYLLYDTATKKNEAYAEYDLFFSICLMSEFMSIYGYKWQAINTIGAQDPFEFAKEERAWMEFCLDTHKNAVKKRDLRWE